MGAVRWLWAAVAAALVSSPVFAQEQEEHGLKYRTARDVSHLDWLKGQSATTTLERPEGVEMPAFRAKTPHFARWLTPRARTGSRWLAIDRSREDGPFDRLTIDSDGDGSLADETAVEAWRSETNTAAFGPVEVRLDANDGPQPYHLNVSFYARRGGGGLYFRTGCWYEGTVEIAQRWYGFRLWDFNANGTFNDASTERNACDRCSIQLEALGTFSGRMVGRHLQMGINGAYFLMDVAPQGGLVEFRWDPDMPMGMISVPEQVSYFEIIGEGGESKYGWGWNAMQVPAGTYRMKYLEYKATDEEGRQWYVNGAWFSPESDFEVKKNEVTELWDGEPVVSTLEVHKEGRRRRFIQRMTGFVGTHVRYFCDGENVAPPRLRIRNEDRTVDVLLKFRGPFVTEMQSVVWDEPDGVKGPYTATVEFEGPVKIFSRPLPFE